MPINPFENLHKYEKAGDNSWIAGKYMITRHTSEPDAPYREDGEGGFLTLAPLNPPFEHDNCVEEVDNNSWIIGKVIISRHVSRPDAPCWEDGEGGFFSISKAPNPKPATRPVSDACPLIENHSFDHTACKGTWEIGKAYLRIGANLGTEEHVTLEALSKRSLGFQVPKVYYHETHDELYHIVYSRLPGKTICELWPKTDDKALKTQWAQQIAAAYHELSFWRGDRISGIDGNPLADWNLSTEFPPTYSSCDPETLRKNCEDIGFDCSDIVFAHNCMMPLSFTIDGMGGTLGISHWEIAGFLPKDWVRTKTKGNSSLDSIKFTRTWPGKMVKEWADEIENALKEKGFRECRKGESQWRSKVNDKWRGF
ncbi:hypothetical protein F53441_1538 [Fusarium austroafricanum]|uniref:Aminoglycoside phosphotransferase domain-containing protein n=1 Tax=Fusarium austroafricanum TaxID=2364996 RepID=A0A8H4KV48_9HYPO|nr:hypothetical protein F53441_1538 [Fusarium austroafricanum]